MRVVEIRMWMCSMIKWNRISYAYVLKFRSDEHRRENEREQIEMVWECREKRNNYMIIKKVGEIRVEGNQGRDRLKIKFMEIIRG